MSNEAYVRALYRIEQLLTGSAMTELLDRRVMWRDWATAIADEWDIGYLMRRELMAAADENAYMGRDVGAGAMGAEAV